MVVSGNCLEKEEKKKKKKRRKRRKEEKEENKYKMSYNFFLTL